MPRIAVQALAILALACTPGPDRTIHSISAEGSVAQLQALSRAGTDLNGADERGWTPLHHAAAAGHAAAVAWLLDNGAECNPRDLFGYTPRDRAWQMGYGPGTEVQGHFESHGGAFAALSESQAATR